MSSCRCKSSHLQSRVENGPWTEVSSSVAESSTSGLQPEVVSGEAIGSRSSRNTVDAPDIPLSGTCRDVYEASRHASRRLCREMAMRSKHPKRRGSFISGLEVDRAVAKEDVRRYVEPGPVVCTFGVAWMICKRFANQNGILGPRDVYVDREVV